MFLKNAHEMSGDIRLFQGICAGKCYFVLSLQLFLLTLFLLVAEQHLGWLHSGLSHDQGFCIIRYFLRQCFPLPSYLYEAQSAWNQLLIYLQSVPLPRSLLHLRGDRLQGRRQEFLDVCFVQ